jgi:HSP20 family protein
MDKNYRNWMWADACEVLARAEQLHRQLFQPVRAVARQPAWEPPIDILETENEVLIFVALPGVAADRVEAAIHGADLLIAGTRALPAALQTAIIHRLELPQGRFERRIPLPPGRYGAVRRAVVDGCLLITLQKAGGVRG